MKVNEYKTNIFGMIWMVMISMGTILLVDNFVRQWGGIWAQSYDIATIYIIISIISYWMYKFKYPVSSDEVK